MATSITLVSGVYEYISDGNEKVFQLVRQNTREANPSTRAKVLVKLDDSMPYESIGEIKKIGELSATFSVEVPSGVNVRIESNIEVVEGMTVNA